MVKQNSKFIEARDKLIAENKKNQGLAVDIMVEFMRLRGGDVNSRELRELFFVWHMHFPARKYQEARARAGVSGPRVMTNPRARNRRRELAEQFSLLMETTPEHKKPPCACPVETPVKAAPKPPPVPTMTLASSFNAVALSNQDLLACKVELDRRVKIAKDALAVLGGA